MDAHGDYLFRFAVKRVGDPDAAEEVVQEALLAALAGRHAFHGRCSERTWLTAILKRKVADWLRREVRRAAGREPAADRAADGRFGRGGKWRRTPGEWAADPADRLARSEFRAALAGCLEKLPPRLRHTFVLRHVTEQSTAEVCRSVGATPANVGVMLHRARLRLSACLSATWAADGGGGRP